MGYILREDKETETWHIHKAVSNQNSFLSPLTIESDARCGFKTRKLMDTKYISNEKELRTLCAEQQNEEGTNICGNCVQRFYKNKND